MKTEVELEQEERAAWAAFEATKAAHDAAEEAWNAAHEALGAAAKKRRRRPGELTYAFALCKECGARMAYADVGHEQRWECSADLIAGTKAHLHVAMPFVFWSVKADRDYTAAQRANGS